MRRAKPAVGDVEATAPPPTAFPPRSSSLPTPAPAHRAPDDDGEGDDDGEHGGSDGVITAARENPEKPLPRSLGAAAFTGGAESGKEKVGSGWRRRLSLDGDVIGRPDARRGEIEGGVVKTVDGLGSEGEEREMKEKIGKKEDKLKAGEGKDMKMKAAEKLVGGRPLGMSVLLDVAGCSKAGWEPPRGVPVPGGPSEVRKENQDAFCIYSPFAASGDQVFLGVFDGHGAEGRAIAHHVRDHVPRVLDAMSREGRELGRRSEVHRGMVEGDGAGLAEFEVAGVHDAVCKALKCSFEKAETALTETANPIDHVFSGTTAIVSWFFANHVYTACAGDSRAVVGRLIDAGSGPSALGFPDGGALARADTGGPESLLAAQMSGRTDGSVTSTALSAGRKRANVDRPPRYRAVELSHDQKPVRPDEKKRVKAAGGRIARWRRNIGPLRVWLPKDWLPGLAMTRSIGDTILSDYGVSPIPEVSYALLTPADSFIVLASDGVWEFMSSQVVVDFVGRMRREGKSADAAAEALVREAVHRWRANEPVVDDTTAVVMWLDCSRASALAVEATGHASSANASRAVPSASIPMSPSAPSPGNSESTFAPRRRFLKNRASPTSVALAANPAGPVGLISDSGRIGQFVVKNDIVA